jgi:hypothetical protein
MHSCIKNVLGETYRKHQAFDIVLLADKLANGFERLYLWCDANLPGRNKKSESRIYLLSDCIKKTISRNFNFGW